MRALKPTSFRSCAMALVLGLSVQGAPAQAPSEKDRRQLQSHLTKSVALLALGGSSAGAAKECEAARNIARRFPPNDVWRAKIEQCFGLVAYAQGQKSAACRRYGAAAEIFAKLHADPGVDSVESDYNDLRKRHAELRCPGRIAALPGPAPGAAISSKDIGAVSKQLLTVYAVALLAQPDADRSVTEKCGLVRSFASRFPADPFMVGAADECSARIEGIRKNKSAACARYQSAESRYASISAAHPAFAQAKGRVGSMRDERNKLGC